jgi:hypothetical protein
MTIGLPGFIGPFIPPPLWTRAFTRTVKVYIMQLLEEIVPPRGRPVNGIFTMKRATPNWVARLRLRYSKTTTVAETTPWVLIG